LTDFLVAALQITSTSNVEENFTEAEEQIELAARRGAELIGLPENFAFLGEDDEKLRLASELSEKCVNFLKTMSQRYQVFLLMLIRQILFARHLDKFQLIEDQLLHL